MIIDSHIHCGKDLPYEIIAPLLMNAGIEGACLFAPVEDIYDRYDPYFTDSHEWQIYRKEANRYLLHLGQTQPNIFPYLFVWNDFAHEELAFGYKGIKWHRHEDEPIYNYKDKRCSELINKISELRLPIVFEESFKNTLTFINDLAPNAIIIIPHLGMLNGGFHAIDSSGLWKRENVYADTSLAPTQHIKEFIKKYGASKLLFGSDFPFGQPGSELRKIQVLDLPEKDKENIMGGNILRLLRFK